MTELQKKKNVLQQLVEAREAVKKKYKLLKFQKNSAERAFEETFKPIVDPLEKLVKSNENKHVEFSNNNNKLDDIDLPEIQPKKQFKFTDKRESDDALFNFDAELTDDDQNNSFLSADNSIHEAMDVSLNDSLVSEQGIDKTYGVRKEGKLFKIGRLPISFQNKTVKVNHKDFPRTRGLDQLLFRLHPDQTLITDTDKRIYKQILEYSSAHKKGHRPDESIRHSSSLKFRNIIFPMFNLTKGSGLLPKYKIAKPNMKIDYVYWDDPNELVDRLRLLIAERSAGNTNHENEIHSIIEELGERGYINTKV